MTTFPKLTNLCLSINHYVYVALHEFFWKINRLKTWCKIQSHSLKIQFKTILQFRNMYRAPTKPYKIIELLTESREWIANNNFTPINKYKLFNQLFGPSGILGVSQKIITA